MDDKRELNDILMGGDDIKSKQSKKIIVLIIGIVVLILAIVIITITMTSSETDEIIISGKENVNTDLPKDSFNNVPVTNEEDQFEKIVQEIKARQKNNDTQTNTPIAPVTSTLSPEVPKVTMPNKAQQPPKAIVTSKPKIATATTQAQNNMRGNNGDIAENGFYLQVGAFSKSPNKEFLDNINKYSYRVQEIMINSKVIKRYLIGPYISRDAAQKDYNNVARDVTTPVHLEVQ